MADLGAEFLLAASTFGANRLTQAAEGAYKTPADLIASLAPIVVQLLRRTHPELAP